MLDSHCHSYGNSPDGNILGPADTVSGIPHGFDCEIDTEHKDQCSDDHDSCSDQL